MPINFVVGISLIEIQEHAVCIVSVLVLPLPGCMYNSLAACFHAYS